MLSSRRCRGWRLTRSRLCEGLEELVREVLNDLETEGAEIPQPLAERQFSVNFNLRLGSDLHRRVASAAAEAGLSINSYLVRLVLTVLARPLLGTFRLCSQVAPDLLKVRLKAGCEPAVRILAQRVFGVSHPASCGKFVDYECGSFEGETEDGG